jgi:hypothetical protein
VLIGGPIVALIGGFTTRQMVTRTIPNEGIRRSLRNALISLLTVGLIVGLVFGLFVGLASGLYWYGRGKDGLIVEVEEALIVGLFVGLFVGLSNGGSAYIKHYVLRFLLWWNNYAPGKYIQFLDYAAERVFLRKVGGGYIFPHRLLMEYFATLQPANQVLED